jgi:hypothetical protein
MYRNPKTSENIERPGYRTVLGNKRNDDKKYLSPLLSYYSSLNLV